MIIAGLTGTIGTGKSTVAAMFAELGAFLIDSDKIAREIVEPDKPAWHEIVRYFGKEVLNVDRTINRQKLADIVFKDKKKLAKLDSITHPAILHEDARIAEERTQVDHDGMIVKEMPLLIELGPEVARTLVDVIIVIYASPEIQLKRLIARGMAEADALDRLKSQISLKEKMKLADFVINNDGSLEETRKQVQDIYRILMNKAKSSKQP